MQNTSASALKHVNKHFVHNSDEKQVLFSFKTCKQKHSHGQKHISKSEILT